MTIPSNHFKVLLVMFLLEESHIGLWHRSGLTEIAVGTTLHRVRDMVRDNVTINKDLGHFQMPARSDLVRTRIIHGTGKHAWLSPFLLTTFRNSLKMFGSQCESYMWRIWPSLPICVGSFLRFYSRRSSSPIHDIADIDYETLPLFMQE